MKEKLEIFELSMELAKALGGDKEAIANIALLYVRHPEMFKNIQDVIKTIDEVVKDPDLIMKNPSFNRKSDDEILVAKQLNPKKMGEVGIKNENGTNIIFHANKKRIKELYKLEGKVKADGGDALTPHTQAQSLDGRLVQKNISSAEKIIPQNSQSKLKKPIDKSNDEAIIPTKQRKR